jgi:hypothetical protein
MDRLAEVIQKEAEMFDIPPHIANDFALRADMLSDHIERRAIALEKAAKEPDEMSVDEQKDKPTEQLVDDDPKSDDQNKPEEFYFDKGKTGAEDDALLRKMLAEEKMAMPEWSHPPKNETGESVEPGGSAQPHWDANAIADDVGGPDKQEPDEPYMNGEFTQEEFHALRDKQQSGQMPKVDGKLATEKFAHGYDLSE